jgi:flagellum-specific peptidoglycan hydrolase FlgJ
MKNNVFLIIVAFLVMACSARRTIIRTTKTTSTNSKNVSVVSKPLLPPVIKKELEITKKDTPIVVTQSNATVILEATTKVKVTTEIVLAYIEKYKNAAKDNMIRTGIPASITLGQAILESGAGTGPLSIQANNHFGIKCHKEWTGPSIRHTDDAENECFRKYDDPIQSFKDHSFFLTSRPRYSKLFQFKKDDYKSWAYGLKSAGYATDPKYPSKLIGLIERYDLSTYDYEVLGIEYKTPVPEIEASNEMESEVKYTVKKGDSLYSLSKKFNITMEELKQKNNLNDTTISLGQTLIIK